MSHGNERSEKVCLNCNARVFGSYCHICGQHNIEPKETVLDLLVHFFNDVTHFEGKFITSMRYLFFRPGFLSKEYERGRRASYMNPIRMYVFTSAFFFIVFFSVFKVNDDFAEAYSHLQERFNHTNTDFSVAMGTGEIKVNGVNVGNINHMDKLNEHLIDSMIKADGLKKTDTEEKKAVKKSKFSIMDMGGDYKTIREYDSVQNTLPKAKKDNWIERQLNYKAISINEKYGDKPGQAITRITDLFLHKMPTIFFMSLPLFALLLLLLYVRNKKMYYVNHLIFTIHYYVFCFLNLLIYFGIDKLDQSLHWNIFSWIKALLTILVFFYLYKAMRNYYVQRRAKTILKFIILNFSFFLITVLLFAGFLLFSVFNI